MGFNWKLKKEKDNQSDIGNDIENESSEKKKKITFDDRTRKIIIICLIAAIVCASCVAGGLIIARVRNGGKEQTTSSASAVNEDTTEYSRDELDAILNQQMMYVNGINYYYQSSSPQLIHDAMGASVFNNSTVSVKSFVVAFCAFDASGNAVKIVQPDEQGEGGYVRTINYDFALAQGDNQSLAPGETCKDILMYVNTEPQIVTVKACIKSYVSTEDVTWENPYYQAFISMYCGKSLNDSEPTTVPGETTTIPNTVPPTDTTAYDPYTTTVPNTVPSTQPTTEPNTQPNTIPQTAVTNN